jgi:hypoxanthine phosphoribosyltransferase
MSRLKSLLTEPEIQAKIKEIAKTITHDYKGEDVLVVGVLKGACLFLSDLIRLIDLPVTVDFIIASSYVKKGSSGEIQIHYDIRETVKNKAILIVEDIVDTGLTIKYLIDLIARKSPKSIKVCTLLNKKDKRQVEVPLDYVGFEIPDLFVVGYGMDYDSQYRNLPDIKVIES